MYNSGGDIASSPTLTNVACMGNWAGMNGGVMSYVNSFRCSA
jgi:hypothetical protein